jgi:hypothetical protein
MASYRVILTAALLTGIFLPLIGASPVAGQNAQPSAKQSLIKECEAKQPDITDAGCASWAKRADYIRKASCPESDANTACSSLRELIEAGDANLMSDLTGWNYAYICFRPKEDVFLEIGFSDPNLWGWRIGKDSLPWSVGSAGVRYYKDGVNVSEMEISDTGGKWTYVTGGRVDVDTLHIPVSAAIFQSDNISIDGSQLKATDSYYNSGDSYTKETILLLLQLSTGRFTETHEAETSGKTIRTIAGRCLVLPAVTDFAH